MPYRETDAKTITQLRGHVDPWFLGRYGMNLYRGCEHGCIYCDGRAERYYVEGDFARDIVVKRNAGELFAREIARRKEPGFVLTGGGVCDAYQPAERTYGLSRRVLEVVLEQGLPVHVITKSALVERDFDLLVRIQAQAQVILSFSLQTVDESVRKEVEPGAASVAERLRLMRRGKELGFAVGAMAMPVLPGLSDRQEAIDALVRSVVEAGADFVVCGGLTLRPGIQKQTYLSYVREHHRELLAGYERVYGVPRASGAPDFRYVQRVDERFRRALRRQGLPSRVPRRFFRGRMPIYAEVAVLLEHEDAGRRLAEEPELGLGRAGWAIQKWAASRISALGRRRGFDYTEVEGEFCDAIRISPRDAGLVLPEVAAEAARRMLGEVRSDRAALESGRGAG